MIFRISELRISNTTGYLIVLLYACLGIINNLLSKYLGGMFFYLTSLLILFMSIFLHTNSHRRSKKYMSKAIIALTFFSILYGVLCQLFWKSGSVYVSYGIKFSTQTFNILINLPIWISCMIIVGKSYYKKIEILLKVLLYILIYNILVTLLALIKDPNYVKDSSAAIIRPTMERYADFGAMGYDLTYSLVLLVPVLYILGKNMGLRFWKLSSFLAIYFIYRSSFFIGLVALFFNIFLSILLNLRNKKAGILLIILLIITSFLLAINFIKIGDLLINISNIVKNYNLSIRFKQLGEFIKFNYSGDSLVRFQLYGKSIEAIRRNPLFGQLIFNNNYTLSGHSTILDIWAGFGIFPLLLFLYSIFCAYRYSVRNLKDITVKRVIQSSYLTFVFVGIFNQVFVAPLILLVPMMITPMVGIYFKEKMEEIS